MQRGVRSRTCFRTGCEKGGVAALLTVVLAGGTLSAQVPRVWDDHEMARLELPLVKPEFSAKHASAEAYYKLPVFEIYKSQPLYRPDLAPGNYLAFLQGQQPELEWDPAKLPTTNAEWIRAGEALFDFPTRIGRIAFGEVDVNDPYVYKREWWEAVKPTVGGDGALPGYRFVIRKKGKIEIGVNACSMCHARVMPDGFIVNGPPGQFTYDAAVAEDIRRAGKSAAQIEQNRWLLRRMYFTPWAPHLEVFDKLAAFDHQQMALMLDGHPGGAMSIERAAPWAPVKVPDLIGVAERKYLGVTGLVQQRGIEDLMRFLALHTAGDSLTEFGSWKPPAATGLTRFSDEQIYALAQYLYSLKAPKNPYKANSFTKKGRAVFEREGCSGCHSGSGFTNEKLMAAPGFKVPEAHLKLYSIEPGSIGTDAKLAMETRRGTGYYRVPSLNGLWYRGPFGHNGSVVELEHWFTPQRLTPEFFPAGFGGLSGPQGAVPGHEFGLRLGAQDMAALLGYLRTL